MSEVPTLPDWLRDPALEPVWAQLRDRLERDGILASGRIRVDVTDRSRRHAVGTLTGRHLHGEQVTLDLAQLDDRLRQRSGCGGLAEVLAAHGGPLRDRPAERSRRTARRTEPLALARELVAGPWAAGWVEHWLDDVRRTGLLVRAADPDTTVRQAAAVLQRLVAEGAGREVVSRVELAAGVLGDSHALDEDRLVHRLVLRALARAAEVDLPATAEARWRLWESYGVSPDLVSSTCLTLGLRVDGDDAVARRWRLATEAGDPFAVSRWDLRRFGGAVRSARAVLVCENPRVLEAVAERRTAVPVVCTAGQPATVVGEVLRLVRAGGGTLHCHGDFDWPGLSILNRLVTEHGARPWRMSAVDYESAARPDAPRLTGAPVDALWDPELTPAMRAFGRSLHEESVLGPLLEGLDELGS